MATFAGFLALLTIFIKTNHFVRFVAIAGYLNCFFSAAPFYSFISYFSLIGACYFYILCTQIKDWKPVFKTLQALIFLNVLFIVLQAFHKDALLSFGATNTAYSGIIGNTMQTGSMLVVLAAFLLSSSRIYLLIPMAASFACASVWTLLAGGIGWFVFIYREGKKQAFIYLAILVIVFTVFAVAKEKFTQNIHAQGRTGTWINSIELANQRAATGWGIGTYKYLYDPLSKIKIVYPWRTAHNSLVQIYFEGGFYFLLFTVGTFIFLCHRLLKNNLIKCFAGLVMIGTDSLVHFPERMLQAVFIIVAFLAYCEFKIMEKTNAS